MSITSPSDRIAALIISRSSIPAKALPGLSPAALDKIDVDRDRFVTTTELSAAIARLTPAERVRLEAAAKKYEADSRLPAVLVFVGAAAFVAGLATALPGIAAMLTGRAISVAGAAVGALSTATLAGVTWAERRKAEAPAAELVKVAGPLFEALPE